MINYSIYITSLEKFLEPVMVEKPDIVKFEDEVYYPTKLKFRGGLLEMRVSLKNQSLTVRFNGSNNSCVFNALGEYDFITKTARFENSHISLPALSDRIKGLFYSIKSFTFREINELPNELK